MRRLKDDHLRNELGLFLKDCSSKNILSKDEYESYRDRIDSSLAVLRFDAFPGDEYPPQVQPIPEENNSTDISPVEE